MTRNGLSSDLPWLEMSVKERACERSDFNKIVVRQTIFLNVRLWQI